MLFVKNMLTSDSNKGSDMKLFFVLLFPFVLIECGCKSSSRTWRPRWLFGSFSSYS